MEISENAARSSPPVLEVCVGSLADAQTAAAAGANRIELCSALELGGLTPSAALIEQVVGEVNLPCMVMLRPRSGGFFYSEQEFDCVQRDAERALRAGADGVVFGMLGPDAEIDASRVERLVTDAVGTQTVFHRAFDFIADKPAALQVLIELGVTRVLTSGGPATALEGSSSLRQLVQQAGSLIEILPAGGIQASSIGQILSETGCTQVHVGAAIGQLDKSLSGEASASLSDLARLSAGSCRVVDNAKVIEARRTLDSR